MKLPRLILFGALLVPWISHAAIQNPQSPVTYIDFQNVTKTSATLQVVMGQDVTGGFIENRQPLKLKYREWYCGDETTTSACTTTTPKETEVALSYKVDRPQPFPVTLKNLKVGQKYVVLIGHQMTRDCQDQDICVRMYYKYEPEKYVFSTERDLSKIPTITSKLSYGNTSAEVKLLTKYLIAKGFMKAPVRSAFDVPTLVGVLRFQMANNMEPDGVIGSQSRTIINQFLLQ
jgi:hypothetical protein